jgi:thiamine biosynthesis lipoprotein
VAALAGDAEAEWAGVVAALDAVADVHRLMSFHEEGSDVTRLNRRAHVAPVEVDPRTFAVLRRAREISRRSGGRFDCTVGGSLVGLGLRPRMAAASRRASWRDVELLPGRRVHFRQPLAVDLGGIAKGFAVDQAIAALERAGVASACVNAGGDLRACGERAWPVAVRAPGAPGASVPLPPLRDGALATTSDAFAAEGGGHVVDPATGRLRGARRSVSVFAPRCMDADALTKAVWLSESPPRALLAAFGARALVLERRRAGPATARDRRAALRT